MEFKRIPLEGQQNKNEPPDSIFYSVTKKEYEIPNKIKLCPHYKYIMTELASKDRWKNQMLQQIKIYNLGEIYEYISEIYFYIYSDRDMILKIIYFFIAIARQARLCALLSNWLPAYLELYFNTIIQDKELPIEAIKSNVIISPPTLEWIFLSYKMHHTLRMVRNCDSSDILDLVENSMKKLADVLISIN